MRREEGGGRREEGEELGRGREEREIMVYAILPVTTSSSESQN